ncbi:hypothetical protein KIN20_028378 [Parelaphostrongylus tenuis]|uniref:Uncharacterized protein n=1 Tax=Parelaphostrongylus tenuis TaxID=148309 RepID=A0AAD5R0Z0_PARTN|nr:hypothetical protein KIN20_028378 [Parelaphostrongylus tenuis]
MNDIDDVLMENDLNCPASTLSKAIEIWRLVFIDATNRKSRLSFLSASNHGRTHCITGKRNLSQTERTSTAMDNKVRVTQTMMWHIISHNVTIKVATEKPNFKK